MQVYECWLQGDVYASGLKVQYKAPSKGAAKAKCCKDWASATGNPISEAYRHVRARRVKQTWGRA